MFLQVFCAFVFIKQKNHTLFFFNSIIRITGIPNTELITFKGICVFSAMTEKNNMISIPRNISRIYS